MIFLNPNNETPDKNQRSTRSRENQRRNRPKTGEIAYEMPARKDEMAAQAKMNSALPTVPRATKLTQDPQLTISQLVVKF